MANTESLLYINRLNFLITGNCDAVQSWEFGNMNRNKHARTLSLLHHFIYYNLHIRECTFAPKLLHCSRLLVTRNHNLLSGAKSALAYDRAGITSFVALNADS